MDEDLKWFLILLLFLFLAWIATGGPSRIQEDRSRPFLEQPYPIENGQTYGLDQLKDRTRP